MKKRIISLFVALFTFFFLIPKVEAGSLSIYANSTTVTKGNKVTITVKASSLAGKFSITSSDSSILSGGTGSTWIENGSQSYSFTAKKAGTATVTVKSLDVGDLSTNGKYTASKSINIKVVNPREKSNNNNLKALNVEGHELSPEFNKDTLEYTVELEPSTEKIIVNATKEDNYASINGGGEITVSEGENKIEIKVTSETGNEKIYTVKAIVKDNNPITTEINGKVLTVVKKASTLKKPELFEETKITINGIEIPAFYNEKNDLTLVGLKDESGSISLYIYDENKNTYQIYQNLQTEKTTFLMKETNEVPEDYQKTTIKIDDKEYTGYQLLKSNFILLYGIHLETGTEGWYSYHKDGNTFQLYNDNGRADLKEALEELKEQDKVIILTLASLSIVFALSTLILLIRKPKVKNKNKNKKQNSKVTEEHCEEDFSKKE
ncbi:MAG: cadherin-like beta sandwich domain-containing protein [Firmicutes bacterium]|nr:cadherin-like beta sandwich domain-containing protein [Bacillota bacterium]